MKKTIRSYLFWLASILLWEVTLHLVVFGSLSRFLPAVGLSCAAAAFAAALSALPGRFGRIISNVLPPLLMLLYAVQLVYHDIFGSLLSLAYVSMGGAALLNFWTIALAAIWRCLPLLLLLNVPVAAFYLLRHKKWLPRKPRFLRRQLALLLAGVLLAGLVIASLGMFGKEANSAYATFRSGSVTIERWAERFGILTADLLDLKRILFGSGGVRADDGLDLTAGGLGARNVMDGMDFDELDRLTEDKDIRDLNAYFASLEGTSTNQYTGMFRDYNLIVVCAEAFSPYVIDPELTPTLYRMSNEGIIFRNFYNSFPSLTTNGEYSLCMGLMPDMSRMSFATSVNNSVPFCLGNQFTAAGRHALAYHNNIGTFYNRVNTHTNMGYDFRAIDFGLDMEVKSPTSDLEMMQKTVDDYIGREPFHAYYMTYSGHADYDFATNAMSSQNRALVEGLDASEQVRAYVACQLELERAMEYLLQRLEEAGIAERTVVVLSGDHMPYGLTEEAYAELAGEAVSESFWKYRNSFICWTGGLAEPMVVEDYCCTQDILPTLLNLFGFNYDSRLLTGRDVLSDCTHVALLESGSFLTEDMIYDSSTGGITWKAEPDEAYAQELIQAVSDQFAVAAAILDTDYYGFALPALGLTAGSAERPSYASYADIAGTWYEEEVELLTAHGALTGGGTGDFQGENAANRAALLAMLTRALQLPRGEGELPYTDLQPGLWYEEPILAARAAGWLTEVETVFRPTDPVTPEETVSFLTAAAAYAGLENAEAWAEETVEGVIASQRDNESPLPEGQISRGACAVAVAELLGQLEG